MTEFLNDLIFRVPAVKQAELHMEKMSGKELGTVSGGSCDVAPKYNCGQDVRFRLKGQDYVGKIWEINKHIIHDIWVYHIKGNDFEFKKVPEGCITGLI